MYKSKNKFARNPWFPIIALVITYAFLFCVFLLTTKFFSPKGGVETINNTLSIWLCAIAAICTILPVVLGIKQNMEMDRLSRRLENEVLELKDSSEIGKKSMEGVRQNLKTDYARLWLRHTLTSFIMQVGTICDLHDFQYKGGVTLADNALVRRLLAVLDDGARRANSLYCDHQDDFDPAVRSEIMGAVLSALSSVRHLVLVYLPLAVSPRAHFDLQTIVDHLSLCLQTYTVERSDTDALRGALYELHTATGMFRVTMDKTLKNEE